MTENKRVLKCNMKEDCNKEINRIDNKGFIYCEDCGRLRKLYTPCRKLTKTEIRALEAGKQLKKY